MEKEFKLDEREGWVGNKPQGFAIYREEDIKEFITIIKKILNRKPDNTTSRRRDLQNRLNEIKKRAGPKLT